ncbi:hypothetical protein NXS19_013554 [Fusarium pseudograminearum]|nr:hypothetical protein NXS19_013554 [Fusarium pseudograminearum]
MRHHEPTKHPIVAKGKGHRVTGSAPTSLQPFRNKSTWNQANHTMPPSLKDKGGRLLAFANAGIKNEPQSQVEIKPSSAEPPHNPHPPPAPVPRPASFPREIQGLGGRNTAPRDRTTLSANHRPVHRSSRWYLLPMTAARPTRTGDRTFSPAHNLMRTF